MLDLSVIVVSYNTRDLLDSCLASTEPETRGLKPAALSTEIIVVDNGSTDGSIDMVRAYYPRVHLIEMGENTGFARATNAGIRASMGRYLMLLNSDTVILDRALADMVSFMDAHPDLAAAGPLLLNTDGTIQTSCFAFTTVGDMLFESLGLTALFPNSPLFNRRGLGGFDRRSVREVDWVSGACLVVRRSATDSVGLLDEGFFMYGEELDWCYRMKQAGLRVAFFPAARVVHHGRASSARARGVLAPRALAGRLRYFRKHHGPGSVAAVRALMAIGMSLRLFALPLKALLRRGDLRADLDWYWGMLKACLTAHV
jgi:hypothetical protein